ncbi:Uncharacterised protein [Amycolatopsis camponoti]|uniref:AAA+ ATPase domain-containing protein n=1 Tax=Amycolatopsis camponoti TaxID=2606593 RepID=A0A6I8LTB3_9PSEU|nr:DUF87 domain-containing protein [Amycolatopsis camponoti]VVJ18885.1 Uncharacterised protein [Amycolatopsis camponoti]
MDELAALAALSFDWADTPDHVWRDSPYHVDGLHADAIAAIDSGIRDAVTSDGPSPIGLVLRGLKGVGKTHLLGLVRRQVHRARGYFFLDDVTAAEAFWENTAEALRRGLARPDDSGESQLKSFLLRVCLRAHINAEVTATIRRGRGLTAEHVEAFIDGLATLDEMVADECGDTARALVLIASRDRGAKYIGEDFLDGDEQLTPEARQWNIYSRPKPARVLVQEITRLLALTGPVVIAVDQLDTLIARSAQRTQEIGDSAEENLLVAQIADGLMGLREVTHKTLTVLTCLPSTWNQIRDKAAGTVPDRFRESMTLGRILDAEVGRALVAKRLGVAYEAMGFTPPHPTWPVAPVAFAAPWEQWTPRQLLKRIGAHIELCLRAGYAQELTSFDEKIVVPVAPVRTTAETDRFADLDTEFEKLQAEAEPEKLLAEKAVDKAMPDLLSAALRCWVTEVGDDDMEWSCERQNGRSEVHAWLTRTLDEAADLQEHWAFRVIAARDPRAALSRFRKARSAAGQLQGAANRHLVILRDAWGRGAKTREEVAKFKAAGGKTIRLTEADARTFWALQKMLGTGGRELHEWLIDRRPASRSDLLSAVLPEKPSGQPAEGTHPPPATLVTPPVAVPAPPAEGEITLGAVVGSGEPVRVALSALRKHAAVFAGSGSGKTVLLRRIVEECALLGVSAIVLDPNNDLARLGDAWPTPPDGWGPDDAQLAKRYLAETDVVVWTPGRATGRPLAFQPLPDFAGVLDDSDEFAAAVEVAVATLAPQARLTGTTAKTNIGLAVLRQAVVRHARTGSRSLPGLIDLLTDLPEDVSNLNDAPRIAAGLAEVLKAAMVNDPLFAGGGEPVDPGVLLTPASGKRARVSVISFVGLQADEQRQNFVNQLQMELFAWIKRNPAGDRPLGALFVMDEAQTMASSGSLTASTRSTIVLASQARKYGLGLLFATQAPKGLHNQVVGNAMTQFFGRLNSPAQIAAANELARAKGSPVADISRLERAQFYVAGEAFGFRQVATPLCLSHHPASPLRLEEVITRARGEET